MRVVQMITFFSSPAAAFVQLEGEMVPYPLQKIGAHCPLITHQGLTRTLQGELTHQGAHTPRGLTHQGAHSKGAHTPGAHPQLQGLWA